MKTFRRFLTCSLLSLMAVASGAHAARYYTVVQVPGKSTTLPIQPGPTAPEVVDPELDISIVFYLPPGIDIWESEPLNQDLRQAILVTGDPEFNGDLLRVRSPSPLPPGLSMSDRGVITGRAAIDYKGDAYTLQDIELIASYKGRQESITITLAIFPTSVAAMNQWLTMTPGVRFEADLNTTVILDPTANLPVTFRLDQSSQFPEGLTMSTNGRLSGVPVNYTSGMTALVHVFYGGGLVPRDSMTVYFYRNQDGP